MRVPQLPKPACSKAVALLSLVLFSGVQGQVPTAYNSTQGLNGTQGLTGFPPCDALINANLSHAVHLPSSPLYPSLVKGSWTLDIQRQSWCFVTPSTAAEVSQVVTALRSAGGGAGDWAIAIRSGGHGSDHQNSITQGVTIDLSKLNTVTYNAATNIASVGTGTRWGQAYASLEKHGVSVTGGREGVVGVGGLLLGGGFSWYSARTGFACDSVANYEVVLASGQIINANASANSDLWRALKGGSSNFGIVTRFDLEAFPAKNLSMQTRIIGEEHSDKVVDAVSEFTNLNQSFRDNALISITTYDPQTATSKITVMEVNTVNNPNTTAFDAFKRIPTLNPPSRESVTLAESANSTLLAGNTLNTAGGILTIPNDPRVMRYCNEQHAKLVTTLKATLGPHNFSTISEFQPLPAYFADFGVKKGGNMLGLKPNSSNKLFYVSGVTLLGPNAQEQLPRVYQLAAAMSQTIIAFSKSLRLNEEFVYLPYADSNQDPLGSYGAANVKHMKQVANKFDPQGFFQRRVPGGFKISRVN